MTARAGTSKKQKPIRVGVIGVGRGGGFASGATELVGMKLVALCDTWEEKLLEAGKRYGVATSIVGILAYRSALNDSCSLEVPDFRKKSTRQAYAQDHWQPDPTCRKEGDPWPSVRGEVPISRKGLGYARKIWKQQGYTGV